jgi:hypothetical protein
MVFLMKVLAAALGRFLADELKEWCPSLTDSLIKLAVRRLPQDLQERYAEEWRAHIVDTPGEIGKLVCAIGILWAGWRIWEALRVERLRSLVEKFPNIVYFVARVLMTVSFLAPIAYLSRKYLTHNAIFLVSAVASALVALVWALETPKDVKPKIGSSTGK